MPTVLILGAGSDIGVAIARKFASKKFDLQLAARRPQLLDPLCSDLAIRYGIHASHYAFDALKYGEHGEFFNSLSPMPDITVCVFGILDEETLAFNDWSVAERMINTNYTGAISILNAAAKKYISGRSGTIIGISSVAGDRGRASKLIYASAKAAFTTYLSGLRNLCFREHVRVLTILPGFVNTKMTAGQSLPQLITAEPSEVAEIIYSAYLKKKNTVYIKWYWRYIMLIIKIIPEFQFKKMNL